MASEDEKKAPLVVGVVVPAAGQVGGRVNREATPFKTDGLISIGTDGEVQRMKFVEPPAPPAPMKASERLARVRADLDALLTGMCGFTDPVACVAEGRLQAAAESVVAAERLLLFDFEAPGTGEPC